MLKPGTILDDRYEIIDVVGTGGMSTVYRAKDERLRRFVAIKVLKSDYSSDQNFVSKFRAEAQSSAGLTHPNIVSVYDVCEDDGRYFIVMELVEGITLKEYINLNGRLSMSQAIDFSIQIASGLEAAHEHHVIHRDIKPQNIIVSKSGNIKVTDFGIAKAATSTTMSTTGIGSVHYISPEQARGGYCDERSDIYSLGITMYEMVTGRVPFEGDTNVAIALMQIQNDMIPPRQLYPDIFPSFEKIILKSTQKKPERRYLTAAALIADLKRVKENPNIDIIVAPATVSGAPTQQFTSEDMQRIKNGSSAKDLGEDAFGSNGYNQNGYNQAGYNQDSYNRNEGYDNGARVSSTVAPDRSRIEALLNQSDDEFYDEPDEYDSKEFARRERENRERDKQRRPARKIEPETTHKSGLKKVSDDEYDNNYNYEEDEDDTDVDPKLEKAVMVGGIAAAVIVALIIFVIVASTMGWFSFGSKAKRTTTTATTESKKDTEETTEATTEEVLRKMPDVIGLSKKAAEKDLERAGFTNIKFAEENSVEVREGYVISQSVDAKAEIPEDSEIVITVSAGAEEIEVSDVKGMDEDEAYSLLKKQGFKPTRSYKFDDDIEEGKVISTDPESGDKAKAGDSIVLYISQGAEEKTVAVPDVSGRFEEEARNMIEEVKLSVGDIEYEFSSDVEEGRVIRQNVPAGTEVKEGTTVGFVISKGAEQKSYKGTVSGYISANDFDNEEERLNLTVNVFISDEEGTHQVFQTNTKNTSRIDVSGEVGGLRSNNGQVIFTVVDEKGADCTKFFSQSLTLSYSEE
ncbi:MAG: serine/threonine protein kinase [Eubacterium sp.]|nr:serine/threonine protein kinase [Eubacterium sp.]